MNVRVSSLLCRKAGLPLLAVALLPCLDTSRAAGVDGSAFDPAQVDVASSGQPQAVTTDFTNAPGTPYPFTNPSGSTLIIGYHANSAQPAPVKGNNLAFDISRVVSGDIVFLLNPAGSNDPSNWAAVFRFLSPADPTGAQGLPADQLEGFDTGNTGPGGFAGFKLFPNTVYVADSYTPTSGHIATATEVGNGSNGLLAGQTAIFIYTVNVPEPATWLELLAGSGIIAGVLRRRNARF